MCKRILVTGGTGYIGSHTVVELQKSGWDVVIVDNLSNSHIETIDRIYKLTGKKPDFECLDCCDYHSFSNIFEKYSDICAVIHFAAYKAVGESCSKPIDYYDNNIVSLLNLLKLMTRFKIKNLVFSSSCTVYGQPNVMPVTEESLILPANCPYGNTKQICEEIIRDTIDSGCDLNGILLRYFNPIGAHPSGLIGEMPTGKPMNLVPFITQTAIGKYKELSVFGNDYNTPDGSCIRDYIDIVDLAKAHVLAIQRLISDSNDDKLEVFNLGTGKGVSVLELIKTFVQSTNVKLPFKIVERRKGDVESIYADCTKANNVLHWKAETALSDTLINAWNWERKSQNYEGGKHI